MAEHVPSPPASRRWTQRNVALLLIAAGVLILLANSDLLGGALWSVLWPLALVAAGADLVTEGRERRRIAGGVLVAAVLLVPLVAASQYADRGRDLSAAWTAGERITVDDVDRIEARIVHQAGHIEISELGLDSERVVDVDGDSRNGHLSLNGRTAVLEIDGESLSGGDLDLELSRHVPLDLEIHVLSGSANPIDLSNMNLRSLRLDLAAGDAQVILPDRGVMDVMIDCKFGNVTLEIPEELPARIETDATIGRIDLDDRFQKQDAVYVTDNYDASAPNRVDIHVAASAGSVNVE